MKTRPDKLVDKIIATSTARARKDIRQWRVALQQAENVENPKRILLYNLYDELLLDAHLYSNIERRMLGIIGSDYAVYNLKTGEKDTEKTALLKRPWFFNFMKLWFQKITHGHSLIQIGDIVDDHISNVKLVNRKHVIPEKGLFVYRQGDEKGIYYREDKKAWDYLLEVGESHDLGLLNICSPHVLYKRFAQAANSEYAEVFGMPLRMGRTNVKDAASLDRMENMLINMGSASYGVVDNDESVEFIKANDGKGEVYENLMKFCNNEISKLMNGSVIGEDSQGGSRSKEEVGERISDSLVKADKQSLQFYANFTLFPKLIQLGYPLEGFGFRFEQSKDLKQLWNITSGLFGEFDVEEKFITDTFGVPVTKKKTPEPPKNKLSDDDFFLP